MSETQVNKTSPISGAPKSTPAPTPPPASMMPELNLSPNMHAKQSNPPTTPTTQPPDLLFDSTKNTPKSTQKIDHFAEQNERRAAQKAENQQRSKRAAIILAVLAGIAIIGLLIWLIISLIPGPDNTPFQPEILPTDMETLRNEADKAYEESGDLNSAEDIFQNTINNILNSTSGSAQEEYLNQIYWTKFLFYAENLQYDKIIEMAAEVNPDLLTDYQKVAYYNSLYQASYTIGDSEAQQRYFDLFTKISKNLYGEVEE